MSGGGGEELIDETVLAASEIVGIEPGRREEVGRVIAARVRGGKDKRDRLPERIMQCEWGSGAHEWEERSVHWCIQLGAVAAVHDRWHFARRNVRPQLCVLGLRG